MARSPGLWDVHTTVVVLHGDQLVVTSTSDMKEIVGQISGPLFRNACP